MADQTQTKLIELKEVSKTYQLGENRVFALRDFSLTVRKGEFIAVRGPSGSGKSTLMNILGCLDQPTAGEFYLNGERIEDLQKKALAYIRNRQIGFVFQNFNLLPRLSALKNTELPLIYARVPANRRKEKATAMLQAMGLGERLYHNPSELSGGEKQRIAIARALINQPSLLLADEPTGNLDSENSRHIMEIFQELNQQGITIILITHEADIAEYAQKIIYLRDGALVEGGHGLF